MERVEEIVDDDETSCLLSPFLLLPRGLSGTQDGIGVLLRPLKLPALTLRLLPESSVNDMIAVVPSAALIAASLRHDMMAEVNGRVCRVYASESLTGDPGVVLDIAMLSPMLYAAVVDSDALNAKVRLSRNFLAMSSKGENSSIKRVVAAVVTPIDFIPDDAQQYADMAKAVLQDRNACPGDIVAVSSQVWIAIEVVDGNGILSSDTELALRVTGPRSKAKITQHMREWARLFWGHSIRWADSQLTERLDLSLQAGSGIIAIQGLRTDVEDILNSVNMGRALLTIDGRCTAKETMEAVANLAIGDSQQGILVCDAFEGMDSEISELLIRAICAETPESYLDVERKCPDGEENALRIVLMCSDVRDLDETLAQSIGHEIRIEAADVNERSSIIRDVLWVPDDQETDEKPVTAEGANIVLESTSSANEDLNGVIDSLTRMSVGFSHSEVKRLANVYIDRGMTGVQKAIKLFGKGHVSIDSGKITWEDIGGLEDAKRQINELISLRKYASQSSNSNSSSNDGHSHRKRTNTGRTGILLYGPPGTGKTLLARAVAGEAGCSFMSVKGPELLDMYVGESERNVRTVFANAIAAAPCVIFFDELDALAPARGRGSDSGGVSDRVVSQLMAELDVVNQRGDIFVLGASNRPDLVDGGLLRPGRFDKLVYVPMPESKEEQEFVLRAQTRKFVFDGPVDLREALEYAPPPPVLSGADLYALSADAWLNAVKRATGSLEQERGKGAERHHIDLLLSERDSASAWKDVDAALERWPNVDLSRFRSTLDNSDSRSSLAAPIVKVSMPDFINAARKILPSLSVEESAQYEHLRRQLESHHVD